MLEDKNYNQQNFVNKVWIVVGITALTIAILLLFQSLFRILLLVLAGSLMAIYLHSFASLIRKWLPISKNVSVLISGLLNFILLAGFLWFVGARLQQQVDELSQMLPQSIDKAKDWLRQYPSGQNLLEYLKNSGDTGKTLSIVKKFFSSSFGILSDMYIILLLGLFFSASPLVYKNGLISLLPVNAKRKGEEVIDDIHKVLRDWLVGQIFGFFFIAILTGLGLWIIGLPLILTLALIAGLMNFIPNFGPIIALVPALLLALMQGTTTAIIVICLYTGIQIVQSAVTQPLIQQKMTSIPPALIIFGQVAMGLIAGFWGVLLATPILAILSTLIKKLYIERQTLKN